MENNVLTALNTQLNKEFSSWYVYLAMSAYFDTAELRGFSAWMRSKAEEKRLHAMKLYDFIGYRNARRDLTPITPPANTWQSPAHALQFALEHEQSVSALCHEVFATARNHNDYATEVFLQWFVLEQVQQEAAMTEILAKTKRVGNDNLFVVDAYVRQRTATKGAKDTSAKNNADNAGGGTSWENMFGASFANESQLFGVFDVNSDPFSMGQIKENPMGINSEFFPEWSKNFQPNAQFGKNSTEADYEFPPEWFENMQSDKTPPEAHSGVDKT